MTDAAAAATTGLGSTPAAPDLATPGSRRRMVCVALAALAVAAGPLNPVAWGPTTAGYPNILGLAMAALVLGCASAAGAVLPWRAWGRATPWLLAAAAYLVVHSALLGAKLNSAAVAVTMLLAAAALQAMRPAFVLPVLAWGLLAAACINAGIGVLQYLRLDAPFYPFFNYASGHQEAGMVFGNIRQPNQFASLMALGLVALAYLARSSGAAGDAPRFGAVAVAVLWLVLGVVLSASRAGVLELVLISLACGWWLWRERCEQRAGSSAQQRLAWLFVALPLVYLLLWLLLRELGPALGYPVRASFERAQTDTHISRINLWHNVLLLIAERPWFGWGIGELGYAHYLYDYGPFRHPELIDNAHNFVLHLAVETGLVGLSLVLLGLALGFLKQRPWRVLPPGQRLAWLVLGCLLLHSGVEYPLHYAQFWLPFALALAVAFAAAALADDTASTPPASAEPAPGAARAVEAGRAAGGWLGCAALALAAAYWAYDYDRISQAYGGPQRRAAAEDARPTEEALRSVLLRRYGEFALVVTTEVGADNAAAMLPLVERALHFSAEPRVIGRMVRALLHLGRDAEAWAHARRFRAAFPAEFKAFVEQLDEPLVRQLLAAAPAAGGASPPLSAAPAR
jgi:O-antigen ligase